MVQSCFTLWVGQFGLRLFRVQGFFASRGIVRLGYILGLVTFFQGLGFCRVQSCFAFRVGQFLLRLGRAQGFLASRGILRLGFILGLVTVWQGLGFLSFRVVFRLGLAFFLPLGRVQGFLAFRGILRLGYIFGLVTFVQGLDFLGFRVVLRLGLVSFAYGWVGFRFIQRLEVFCGQGRSQGQLRLFRVQVFQGLELFCAQGWLVLLTVGQGSGLFSVQRYFAVRVDLRVSYVCLGFRFFRVQSCFALRVGQFCLRLGRVQVYLASRGILRLGQILGLVTFVQGLGFLGFRVVLRLGLASFAYGWVGFRFIQRLEVFCGQGICQGQLRLCRVQAFEGLDWFCTLGYFVFFFWFLRFQGFLWFRVLRLGYFLGLVTIVQGLGFLGFRVVLRLVLFRFVNGWVGFGVFRVQRFFALRVRVSVSFLLYQGFFWK